MDEDMAEDVPKFGSNKMRDEINEGLNQLLTTTKVGVNPPRQVPPDDELDSAMMMPVDNGGEKSRKGAAEAK